MEKIKKTTSFLEVLVFEPEADQITDALGITDERTHELTILLKNIIDNNVTEGNGRITDDIYTMSINCKHVNELSFLIFGYGKYVGEQMAKIQLSQNMGNIQDLFKRFPGGSPLDIDGSDNDVD